MRRRHLLALAVLMSLLVGTVVAARVVPGPWRSGGETLERAELAEEPATWPTWGFTHTQYSADHGSSQAVQSVARSLTGQPLVQAQALMGWGAGNPEPTPGEYVFDSLDSRIDFIRRSGGVPVITLCCAPDWMKGGEEGETDWSELETAPEPEHYADFARLAAVVAERYPDVHHFMVWNEFKGFWDEEADTWDAVGYTDFYNQVHAAVKAANPQALVGGPYVTLGLDTDARGDRSSAATDAATLVSGTWGTVDPRPLEAFDYWLANNDGADFVVVDGHAVAQEGSTDPFEALPMFSAVNEWIQERTDLPIWWAEWYLDPEVREWPADQQQAVYTAAMMELARSGAETVLYWNPRPADASCAGCLWTDTSSGDGGQTLDLLAVLQDLARWFPAGTELQDVDVPAGVAALAQREAVLLVNTTGRSITATVNGDRLRLTPYDVRWVTT
ncbi:hypothetical protein [uncultured Modestobacter sp.]|uniref:hypothetical protein n=1 Tax=uncultured Modestobacter sp. TaxID=380048 RepID=UPI002637DB26|nr:hypothetical protein [uncultured Modestobacter sp.]